MSEFVLQTPRLRLRALRTDDFDFAIALTSNPEVARYLGPPQPEAELRRRLSDALESQRKHGFTFWTVELISTGQPIGRCGLGLWEIDGAHELALAYLFAREYWGQGYASEAAQATIEFAFNVLNRNRVVALVESENRASMRVLEKLGMRRESTIDYHGDALDLWALQRS